MGGGQLSPQVWPPLSYTCNAIIGLYEMDTLYTYRISILQNINNLILLEFS